MKYYVIGVLQQQVPPDEWVFVDSVVEAEPGAFMDAALEAGARKVGRRWRDWERDPERDDWNYWLLAVVELSPGLPVVYSGAETYMPGIDALAAVGRAPSPLWVGAGQDDAGSTWVYRFRAADARAFFDGVRDFAEGEGADVPDEPYGLVREDGKGRYTVFGHDGRARSVESSTHAWGIPRAHNPAVEHLKRRLMP